ncbi:hypothetical protein BABINDRAFT_96419 [Babjeviella inositovora NRRL Y-12698]|uniref:Uncharacterized protein n=1 Tax=Babjeviella inositovora NRRL Y-12698 TaxID=984486 RepID=A0A1E3QKS4_9ASCO|nr:uncharacterized protein BABINDRAFT_96419 [Babjeviella inositovora NRRL Y-12698]ODQ77597.1 hypothetical protein BABINDRAFT_96419 [Babjeviella inositovora NRRL Y-12698]
MCNIFLLTSSYYPSEKGPNIRTTTGEDYLVRRVGEADTLAPLLSKWLGSSLNHVAPPIILEFKLCWN